MDGCPAVVYADWELIFWCEPVVDIDNSDTGFVADMSTPSCFALQASKHPSTTVKVQMYREWTRALW